MPTRYVVRQGDTSTSLAARFGFGSGKALHDHGDNAELKRKRPHPDMLLPGDVVTIPDRDTAEVDAATGRMHTFKVRIPRIELKLRVVDHRHRALAGKDYRLEAGGVRVEGQLGDDGLLDVLVPATTRDATLRIWLHPRADDGDDEGDLVYPIGIGHLDPEDEVSGVQGRLASLDYKVHPSGEIDAATRTALEMFQRRHGLDVTGEADGPTRDKLREIHEG